MRSKAKYGLIGFSIILFAIWTGWYLAFRFGQKIEHVEGPTLADSIKRGKERAKMAQDSVRIVDSVYTASEGGLKQTKHEITRNTPAINRKRDSLRAELRKRAYADSVNRK